MKFYNVKIYTLVLVLNAIPFIIASKKCSGDGCLINVIGIFYMMFWILSYIPFLFVAIKRWNFSIQTERVLFFLPTGIATSIYLFFNLYFPELDAKMGALIIIPNLILQLLFYLTYLKKIRLKIENP
ncbi:hypothetical protein [Dokdonia pacifica]|uniref:Uncharacterized protein n=1 Tax=Dokdonia pacifica TaxID=1627892 RepID=A0A239CYI4_9FLAO|nr:hypothetical protein [Dokdonia pacifica]SNS25316.1 hypothetical protein SAMN06265376_10955 [Dokdonia pacifica]